jgi:Trk K+ transport system NAD-binding subunit
MGNRGSVPCIQLRSLIGTRHFRPLAGITLGGFNLRKRYNLLVLAIRRGDEMITGLSGEARLEAGNIAIIYMSPEDIAKGADLFLHPDRF